MAPLHGGFSAGKSGLCLRFIRSALWAACVCTNQSHVFFIGCLSLGPRKNDLTNYWALGLFVRPFTSLVDPGDIYPPHLWCRSSCDPSGTFKSQNMLCSQAGFSCTNNIAEYEALLLGLRKLRAMGIRRAILKTDSQVIAGHVDKSSKARDPKLERYLDAVRRLEASFEGFSVKNIPRGENERADLLAKSAAQGLPLPSEVFFETIKAPSVELMERAVLTISPVHSEDWRTEIISFLQGNCLSRDEAYKKRMEARTRPYVIIEGELYKQGVCSPLLKCLSRIEGMELMKEIHEVCVDLTLDLGPCWEKFFDKDFTGRRQLRMQQN
jgi:ribonuclease HI